MSFRRGVICYGLVQGAGSMTTNLLLDYSHRWTLWSTVFVAGWSTGIFSTQFSLSKGISSPIADAGISVPGGFFLAMSVWIARMSVSSVHASVPDIAWGAAGRVEKDFEASFAVGVLDVVCQLWAKE